MCVVYAVAECRLCRSLVPYPSSVENTVSEGILLSPTVLARLSKFLREETTKINNLVSEK